ncbi:MAG: segregation/condensation protein A [Clostridiales bacterium]|jgi:segregation and condensation protein A|nr:segregation/condensation protein A [Clostridiales bacterium]
MENLTFHLEGIVKSRDEMQDFSGPLNLILMLLSKNKIEIRDLHISEILDQYLEYISKMKEMDLDVASEFVQMASHLVYLKTRTLLAGEEEISELEELMNSLEQLKCHDAYMSIKAVTSELAAKAEQGILLFSKTPEPLKKTCNKTYTYSHEPQELLAALLSVFSRGEISRGEERVGTMVPKRIIYGVREKCSQLIEILRCGKAHTLSELYLLSRSRSELIATFISVLELCSMGSLEITESDGELAVSFIGEVPAVLPELVSD